MSGYQVKQINEYSYLINDNELCTSYLIIGKNKALLIDAGFKSNDSLIDEVKKLTNKEIIVALTHGHYDHIGHLDEFDNFYMSKKDEMIISDEYKYLLNKAIDINKDTSFDLGDIVIEALCFEGHTPGTVIFVDKKPMLKNKQKYFSISHSEDLIALAFSDSNCGVDIEKIKYGENSSINDTDKRREEALSLQNTMI